MAIEGRLVRTLNGVEGRIYAVAVAEYNREEYPYERRVGFVGLLKTEDGKLTSVMLEGAELLREPPPVPTSLPGPGERR